MRIVQSFVRFCDSEFGTQVIDREAKYVRQHIDADDRILDVGCGIGSLEARLSDHDIIGIDRSAEMVRTASERVSAPIVFGDARELPVATDAVDTGVFVATLSFVSELDCVLAETTRVLKPDGRLIALLLNTRSEYVQSNLEREGSYFQRMVHRDADKLVEQILDHIDGTQEHFLGIENQTVYESDNSETAAITAVVGSPN